MDKFRKKRQDYWLSLAVFALVAFGLIMIYSVSKYYSLQVTDQATDKYYLQKQLISAGIGLVVWVIFQSIDYRFWQKNSAAMLVAVVILLLVPILFGGEGKRWINLFGFQFQPAELAKLAFLFYLSGWFASKGEDLKAIKKMFGPFLIVMAAVAMLLLGQKDLGTLSVFVVIGASVFMAAGSSIYHLGAAGGMAVFLLWLAVKLEPYRMERVLTFLNPENNALGSGYHIRNALIAVGSGGLWGLGFGQSRQKYLYLPEAHTDSIFAIISEELGLVRASLIVLLFVIIALRGYKIASEAPDIFSRLLAVGITSWIIVQAFVNIAAMLSMVPLTGVPLPFVSYGGSSLIILLAAVGVLTNVAKNRKA